LTAVSGSSLTDLFMSATVAFDAVWVFVPGGVFMLALLAFMGRRLRQGGLRWREVAALLLLRGAALGIVLVLLARPVSVQRMVRATAPYVSLLLDRSLSMSLVENGQTRYARAYDLVKNQLAPALNRENWKVRPLLFAESANECTPEEMASAPVNGARTNLAGALVRAATVESDPPLAILALTDGAANDNRENNAAVTTLLDRRVPVFAIGMGSERGPPRLALDDVTAPSSAAVKQEFRVTARLSASGSVTMPAFHLVLLRDGQLLQTREVSGFSGARSWTETFPVSESAEGRHNYEVDLASPTLADLVIGREKGAAQVTISNEKDLRILYIQGALTWDYKFILRALASDPSVRMTGLSRTSNHSTYRQNVEKAGELVSGFPTTLDQLAPFRAVVISNLKARDLTQAQQDILTRFCGELGGGVLLIGGAETFDNSWQGTTLEKLLPVTIDTNPGLNNVDEPFHLRLTDEALRSPIFQIADGADANAAAWNSLPTFTHYGRVERAKPGAVVWAEHDQDVGPAGKRILMASQSYGAGRTAVLCVQNFWRWRLARNADPLQFDRFWRQFFRYLSDAGQQSILIDLTDQQIEPPTDVHVVLQREKTAADESAGANPLAPAAPPPPTEFSVEVKDPEQRSILDQPIELPAGQDVPLAFHAEKEGFYTIEVLDSHHVQIAERSVQLIDDKVELARTDRDMDNLEQWAAVTQGAAYAEEDLPTVGPLIEAIHAEMKRAESEALTRAPLGLNAWVLLALFGALAVEWLLRKRWNLP
jgi:uncharacterized membrane protein